LYCAYLKRDGCEGVDLQRISTLQARESEMAQANLGMVTTVSNPSQAIPIELAHARLGHMDVEKTRSIAKHLRWNLSCGTLKPCAPCAIGKAWQAPIKPPEDAGPVDDTKRVFLDISSLKLNEEEKKEGQVLGTSFPYWRILVDGLNGFCSSIFTKTKSPMFEPTCKELHHWITAYNREITSIRMDNAGENKRLAERMRSSDWKMTIKPEFTSRATPQQNSKAEVHFPTLVGRMKAMYEAANVPKGIMRRRLFPMAAQLATKMSKF
jgi:hypothetical protein